MGYKSTSLLVAQLLMGHLSYAQTNISVNMITTIGQATSRHYGINIETGLDPNVAVNESYKSNFIKANIKFIRYHGFGMTAQDDNKSWVNFQTKTWDIGRIKTVLDQMPQGAEPLINLPIWPSWMDIDDDGKLDSDKFEMYAEFCASLVEIVNIQLGKSVKYWEPINEWDSRYEGVSEIQTVARIYVKCFDAMKAKDSNINIGGGAWSQPWDNEIDVYLNNISGKLDFWTHHSYAGCNERSITTIYSNANIQEGASHIRAKLDAMGFSSIPIWINETNIDWAWDCSQNNRMTNEIGAVFDALVIKRAIESGVVDGINAWNDADGTYGKLFSEYDDYKGLHQGGYLLKFFNQHGLGEVKSTASSNEAKAEGYTVQNSNGDVMFVLINKNAPGTVTLKTNGWSPSSSTVLKKVISSAGISESTVSWSDALANQTLSANSIIIYIVGSSIPTPLINLPFNENGGTIIENTGSVGGVLSKSEIPTWSTNVPKFTSGNSSLDFGSSFGDFAAESESVLGALTGLENFTITGWVNNRTSTESASGGNRIVSWYNGSSGVDLVYISDGSLRLGVNESATETGTPKSSKEKITTDNTAGLENWKFFAVTYSSVSSMAQFYFGERETEASIDVMQAYDQGAIRSSTGRLAIGHYVSSIRSTMLDAMFRGLVDEIQIFNQVLSPYQIIKIQHQSAIIVGTENELEQNITIYPNPSNGKFKIDLMDSDKATIVVYDIYGKIIYNQEIFEKSSYVDLGGRTGIFVVIVKTNKNSVSKKVLAR